VAKFKGICSDAAKDATDREVLAELATRKYNDFLKAKFLENYIGERFVGMVSGVTRFGLFIELDSTAEGMIKIENLDGHFEFDEAALILKGNKQVYRMGQKVEIEVAAVRGDRAEFILV